MDTPPHPDEHSLLRGAAPPAMVTLEKGRHRWRFVYQAGQESSLVSAAADLAQEPASGLDHFDLAILAYRLGRLVGRPKAFSAHNCTPGP